MEEVAAYLPAPRALRKWRCGKEGSGRVYLHPTQMPSGLGATGKVASTGSLGTRCRVNPSAPDKLRMLGLWLGQAGSELGLGAGIVSKDGQRIDRGTLEEVPKRLSRSHPHNPNPRGRRIWGVQLKVHAELPGFCSPRS